MRFEINGVEIPIDSLNVGTLRSLNQFLEDLQDDIIDLIVNAQEPKGIHNPFDTRDLNQIRAFRSSIVDQISRG